MVKGIKRKDLVSLILFILILTLFYLFSLKKSTLFHSSSELFTICIYLMVIALCWNCQDYIKNRYLLFVGLGYLTIGLIDFFYFLSLPEFALFDKSLKYSIESETAALFLESLLFLVGFIFIKRKAIFNAKIAAFIFISLGALIIYLIYIVELFPPLYLPQRGRTKLLLISYLIIIFNFTAVLCLLRLRYKNLFSKLIYRLLSVSIATKLALITLLAFNWNSEIHSYNIDFLYHITKLSSSYIMYKAIIEIGLKDPFSLIFRELKESERQLSTINRELEIRANTDSLTGLYNHCYICNKISEEIERFNRYQSPPFSIIMFDLDHFKRINDLYGHQTGDSVLIKSAEIITDTLRGIDITGRYGGEEFLILLPQTDLENSYIVAERIRANISSFSYNINEEITISGGVAQFKAGNIEELIKEADEKLYRAKRGGRNRIIL